MQTNADETTTAPFSHQQVAKGNGEWKTKVKRIRAGLTCPKCNAARLDYNGLLQLACPRCGVIEAGVFT